MRDLKGDASSSGSLVQREAAGLGPGKRTLVEQAYAQMAPASNAASPQVGPTGGGSGGLDRGAADPHERHADRVADAVVAGESAAPILDEMAVGGASQHVVQRSPLAQAAQVGDRDPAPPRGAYVVELSADGNYVFGFNTFDLHKWSEPTFTALRYYMQQVFPGVGDDIIRSLLKDLHVVLQNSDPVPTADDQRYDVIVRAAVHHGVIAWMHAHHASFHPRTLRLGGASLRQAETGASGAKAHPQTNAKPPSTTVVSGVADSGAPADSTSRDVEAFRALYERLRKAFPEAIELRGRSVWPEFLAYAADHATELTQLRHGTGQSATSLDDLRKLLAQFQAHHEAKLGDRSGEIDGHDDGQGREKIGAKDGDIRTTQAGGTKTGSIYGEPGGSEYGRIRWEPKGKLQVRPKQPTYVAGASVQVELEWDLSVHPDAGLILLPGHCEYVWGVRHNGELVDRGGRSVLADDRRTSLDLGDQPGVYQLEVTATSAHFKAPHRRLASSVVVHAVAEQAFDKATFDAAHVGGPEAAFSRDNGGKLHLRDGATARTTQQDVGSLDLAKGGIDELARQGKITDSDREVIVGQLEKKREALLHVQEKTKDGTPYVVRGTFVSREDSSTLPLNLLMHVLRRTETDGVARYDLILHDTTFDTPTQHPGRSLQRIDHERPAAVYHRLEGEALEEMAGHFHAHNEYPKGTVHLAVQELTTDEVWEKTLDTDNGRKKTKRAIGKIAAVGAVAMMVVPGGTAVSAGLMVVTSAAGLTSVALEIEGRIQGEGHLKLDRRLAMDVLQVVAVALPFGTLAKTFAGASAVGGGRFLLCMTSLDVAQGFVVASAVRDQLDLIDADTAAQLAGATSDEQRRQLYAERDRRVAEVIGGAIVNEAFALVSLGHGIKNLVAITRSGAAFTVRKPVRDLATQGRERMQEALASETFAHEGERVQLTAEERRYLEHEVAGQESPKSERVPAEKPTAATREPANEPTETPATDKSAAHEREPANERSATDTSTDATPASGPEGPRLLGQPLHTDAKPGLAASEATIAAETVEMELHPEYPARMDKVRAEGFNVATTAGPPRVEILEVVDKQGKRLEIRRTLFVRPKMRFLDLEHEMGHIEQLKRFAEPPPTKRKVSTPRGEVEAAGNQLQGILTTEQNAITEYHNRLAEFVRLCNTTTPDVLAMEFDGIQEWRVEAENTAGLGRGNNKNTRWAKQYFSDIPDLESRVRAAGFNLQPRTTRW